MLATWLHVGYETHPVLPLASIVPQGGKKKRDFRRWQNNELAGLYAKLVQLGPGRTADVRAEVRSLVQHRIGL